MLQTPIPILAVRAIDTSGHGWLRRRWPEILGAATALLFAMIFRNVIPGPDVAWQLWIAHQIRLGARLYIDIVETNPPLWFWEAVPLDWVSGLLRIPSHVLLVVATGGAAALSVWATGRLVSHIPAPWRAMLLVYAALTLLLMPLIDTGQREQFVLIGALPYAALAAARRDGRAVPLPIALLVAGGAALGLALKHYFLIAPQLVELWLFLGLRRAYRPLRAETIVLAVLAVLYVGAIAVVTPAFLTRMVPIDRIAYAGVGAAHLSDMASPIQVYWLIVLTLLLFEIGAFRRSSLSAAMAVSAFGFALAWFIQFKGYPYHSIPASGCLMMTLACLVVECRAALRAVMRVTAPTILLLPLGFTAWYGPYRDDFGAVVRPMLAGVGPRDSVAVISYQAVFAWPLSLYRDAPYPSRQYGMWILESVAHDHGRTPALTRIGRQVVAETTQDYRCAQPVRIIINRRQVDGMDLSTWFMADAGFADLMSHYRRIGSRDFFDLYRLATPYAKPPPSACRRSF